ncbi:hypothetical protein C0J52_04190 [Blattella germanica]|nr:hypothetical protein C0J52_04190 [Blattella germanica]
MVMMYRFVFWFSTRFGSLVVAALTLMQSLSALIACCLGVQNQDEVKKQLDTWLKTNEMMFMTGTLEDMRRDPETYLTGFIVYFTLHCVSGFLLIFGALRIVKELEFVYAMGHYHGGRLNVEEYQHMNVPELGAEYYPREQGYNMLHNNYIQQNYGREYFNDKFTTKFRTENDFASVLAKPVY